MVNAHVINYKKHEHLFFMSEKMYFKKKKENSKGYTFKCNNNFSKKSHPN